MYKNLLIILMVLVIVCVLSYIVYDDTHINNIETFATNIFKSGTIEKSIFETYGPTYYKDPSLMTPAQKTKFLKTAKFGNMTIGDYINWLLLSEKLGNPLSFSDTKVLLKFKAGSRLSLDDIPEDKTSVPKQPQSAQTTFNNFMNGGDPELTI
jgi:hypothetical protein